jgi:hypothetical protein
MLSRSEAIIPSELVVEIVPHLFLSKVSAYDENVHHANCSYFAVSDIEALQQANIDLSF